MTIEAILAEIEPYRVKHVLLTGGEPLLQRQTSKLLDALVGHGYTVSIETHGEVSIENFAPRARIIMDVKTPASGMSRGGFRKNLKHLKPTDEVKFVIASEQDYSFAKKLVESREIPTQEILFSAAQNAPGMPGQIPGVSATWLADQILKDRLPVRLQMQLHKLLWGHEKHGV
jgi:7-carboxy-7-deazaguanine synthase